MAVNYKKIGERIQSLREYRGISVSDLANKTNFTTKSILLSENGRASISVDFLIALCAALNVTPNDILQGEFEMPETVETDTPEMVSEFIDKLDEIKQSKLSKSVIKDTHTTIMEIKKMVDECKEEERAKKSSSTINYKARHFEV